jgi:hypothetical protein
MIAEMPEALTPFARASSANCLFQVSKPADELPHCAAPACATSDMSAAAAPAATAIDCPHFVIWDLPESGGEPTDLS